jgi:hypothetical protein
MSSMQVVPLLRREVARQLLTEIGRGIASDAVHTEQVRSREQHFRNGVGGLLESSSNLVYKSPLAIALHVSKKKARAELSYAVGELLRAGSPATERQRRVLLVAAPSVALVVLLAARVRRNGNAGQGNYDPVERTVSPEPVAAGVAE